MYKSVEQIERLRQEKLQILSSVYENKSLDRVYEKQNELGKMAISIYTDVADAVMPVLKEDGVGNIVWPNISLRLERLSFISVPSSAEIEREYRKTNPSGVKEEKKRYSAPVARIDDDMPKTHTETKVKKIALPAFFALLAAQGIAIPLIIKAIGGTAVALVKVLNIVNGTCMVIEVIEYFDLFSSMKKRKKSEAYVDITDKNSYSASKKEKSVMGADDIVVGRTETAVDDDKIRERAIEEVYKDNVKALNEWFDKLVRITEEEIEKALKEE